MRRSSQTADAAVAMRYVATLSDRCRVFDDPYASIFLTPSWRILLCTAIQRRILTAIYNKLVPGMVGDVLIRSRYVQDQLLDSSQKRWTQHVILGAGWDSTALRLENAAEDLQIFELDHPLTHQAKQERLAARGVRVPGNVTFVPIDFEEQKVSEALRGSAFDRQKPALFFMGGVTFYLTRYAILGTLADIASCAAARSELIFDYLDAELFAPHPPFPGAKRLAAMASRRGEPFLCGFEPMEIASTLHDVGFELLHHFVGAEQAQLHAQATIGIFPPSEYIHLVHARVAERS